MKKTNSHTHSGTHQVTIEEINTEVQNIKEKLQNNLDDQAGLARTESILDDLTQFSLGRFLIKNKSLDGYMTYYVIAGYQEYDISNETEKTILEQAPIILATRERFYIFQDLILKSLKSNMTLCSVPCGVMADFFTLAIPDNITNVSFVGIDYDQHIFKLAEELKTQCGVQNQCELVHADAWALPQHSEFDILTSNGLNIYEKDDDKVIDLYKNFYQSIKPGGKFIGSSTALPDSWKMNAIDPEALDLQKMIFGTILQATWANARSIETTEKQLTAAGFKDISFYPDKANMFYSFEAMK